MNYKLKLFIFSLLLITFILSGCAVNKNLEIVDKYKNWEVEKIDITKKQVNDYFVNNSNLDPIEGIWKYSFSTKWVQIEEGRKTFDKTQPFKNLYKVAIKGINKNEYVIFYYEGIGEEKDSSTDKPKSCDSFGDIKGKIKSAIGDNEYIFTESSPLIINDIMLTLKDNELYGARTGGQNYGNNSSINVNSEHLFVKTSEFSLNSKNESSINKKGYSGSGIVINNEGLVVTNYHLIQNSDNISVILPKHNKEYKAEIVIKDINNDLCILQLINFEYVTLFNRDIPFKIVSSINTKVGEEVYTLGFPLGNILGKSAKFSSGKINSLFGINDDPRVYQISNPVQPGNSGGPLFNFKGEFIGIVFSSLNAKFFYENSNVIPQNVNFAVKSDYLLNLIKMLPEEKGKFNKKNKLNNFTLTKQIELIKPYIVNIITK